MREIYILLENRIKNNEILIQEDIVNIINWYLEKNFLTDFLKEIHFIEFPNNYMPAWYNNYDLKLYINLYQLIDENIKTFKLKPINYEMSVVNYCNYLIIITLFHELKHIMQYRDFLMKNETKKALVLDLYSLDKDLFKNRELYRNYHDLFPCEREALITSHDISLTCFQNIDDGLLSRDELKVYQLDFIKRLIKNYDGKFKIKSPFEQLLVASNDPLSSFYKEKLKREYIPLYNRLELGLPISKQEYQRIKNLRKEVLSDSLKKDENIKELILKRG